MPRRSGLMLRPGELGAELTPVRPGPVAGAHDDIAVRRVPGAGGHGLAAVLPYADRGSRVAAVAHMQRLGGNRSVARALAGSSCRPAARSGGPTVQRCGCGGCDCAGGPEQAPDGPDVQRSIAPGTSPAHPVAGRPVQRADGDGAGQRPLEPME